MKKILPFFVLSFFYLVVEAQTPVTTPISPQPKGSVDPASLPRPYYCCRFCDYTALNPRSCPVHQTALVKVGTWYCPMDGKMYTGPGKCSGDQSTLVRMEMKFKTLSPKPSGLRKDAPLNK